MKLNIRKISLDDLNDVVKIHSMALPDDVLPNLGITLLDRYYKSVVDDKSQLIVGSWHDGHLLGYCLTSKKDITLTKLFSSVTGLLSLTTLMLSRPGLFYSGLKQAMKTSPLETDEAEIAFIAVSPKHQGNGVGKAMIAYAVQVCREEGIAFLKTKTSNKALRNYYLRNYLAQEIDSYAICGKNYSVLKWSTSPPECM